MTLKEILLQELETADDELITQTINWLRSHKPPVASDTSHSIVDFFRNSPLCEVAEELDLTRDRSPIPDRNEKDFSGQAYFLLIPSSSKCFLS